VRSGPDETLEALPSALGGYRISGILGRGGMGVVYRAEHPETRAPVALKTVRVPSEPLLASIRREIHALRRLRHPGIARILDEGVAHGLPFYVMEFVEGRTLRAFLKGRQQEETAAQETAALSEPLAPVTLPTRRVGREPRELRSLLARVHGLCAPLAYLHGEGLVHRDLKPENVFIREDGRPVLVDLGIAASFGGAASREQLAADGKIMGSAAYMAPEQILGELVDARADLYALGCILYECLTGRPPFLGTWTGSILFQHLTEAPVPPSRQVEGIPEELDRLVLRLLAKRPDERLGYAEDVAQALVALGIDTPAERGAPRPRSYLYRPGLEGRAGPLEKLGSALRALHTQRSGQLIILEGESGVGKTRLAMEFARLAAKQQVRVVTGQCAPLGLADLEQPRQALPLQPLRALLQALADRCRAGPADAERLLGTGGRLLAIYEPSLAELLGVEEPSEPVALPPAVARQRVLETLRRALLGLARQMPLLLILDDLQWADELSLAFLQSLAGRDELPGLLVLGTCRAEELGGAAVELLSSPGVHRLPLGRLDTGSVGAMVAGMLALRAPPDELVRFLAASSDGNPFFIAEYLRAAIDEGVLARDHSGAWHLARTAEEAGTFAHQLLLPRTLAELIERRLAMLGGLGRSLLEGASVLGREFDEVLLLAVAGLGQAQAVDVLEELRRRQILEETASGRLRFVHDKLREIAYERTPLERRRGLHRDAALALEARSQSGPEVLPELGYHFSQSGVHDKALLYLSRAAEQARVTYANAEAIRLYRAALLELPHVDRAHGAGAALQEALGDVLVLVGRHEEARAAYAVALEATAPEHGLERARLLRKSGKAWELHHAHDEALAAYRAAEQALRAAPSEAAEPWWNEWLHVQIEQLSVYYWTARLDAMEELSRRIQPAVEQYGTPLQRGRFFEARVQRNLRAERYLASEETVHLARAYLRASEDSRDPEESAEAGCVLACVLLWHGALEEAAHRMLATVEQARRRGDVTLETRGLTYLTQIHRRHRSRDATRDFAQQSLRAAQAGKLGSYLGAAHANLGWVALGEGRLDEAEHECRAALQHWEATSLVYPFEWMALLPLVSRAHRLGRTSETTQWVARLLQTTQQRLPDVLVVLLQKALAAWAAGREEGACAGIEAALREAEREGYL
jgi:serine/threonine protein kinase/tetratricopeptide (TPR) repeat protein